MTDDPHDLDRFVEAQISIYSTARGELKRGHKQTHWMWFIFPQFAGLGYSSMAQKYAIQSLDEARDYLEHPILGPRLLECSQALLDVNGKAVSQILGYPDDLKLKSSMTLFETVASTDSVFTKVLDKYFEGERDEATLGLLNVK